MVQMLVSVMCRKASKKRSRHHGISDDPFKLAAGLRMHKSEKAFSDMAEEFEEECAVFLRGQRKDGREFRRRWHPDAGEFVRQ